LQHDAWFRFASAQVRLRTDEPAFRARFVSIFHDCHEDSPQASNGVLELEVHALAEPVLARIPGHEWAKAGEVLATFFPELELIPLAGATSDRVAQFACAARPNDPVISARDDELSVASSLPWQRIVAHYFLNHAMSAQPDLSFFHAASVAIGDRGVLISGDKGAGKSTLSLALAARGHAFLGDEVAAIDGGGTLLPFPRAVSIRPGPQAQAVSDYLERHPVESEVLPDGTHRLRLPASRIFPGARGRPARLTHAFFITGREKTSSVAREFRFASGDLRLLAPLYPTVGSTPSPAGTLRLLRLFAGVRCFILSPGGTPDQTAEQIAVLVEKQWDTASNSALSA
jgi:hypothetical protein